MNQASSEKQKYDETRRFLHCWSSENNARIAFQNFRKAIEKKENREIEESCVFKVLRMILNEKTTAFHDTIKRGSILFRCRIVKTQSQNNSELKKQGISVSEKDGVFRTCGFDKYNSKECPLGLANEGRANRSNISYLYLADDGYTACAEVKPYNNSIISLASFTVKRDLRLINLCDDQKCDEFPNLPDEIKPEHLITLLMLSFSVPYMYDGDYSISQIIADYIRKAGYDGVCYMSYITTGKNIALFNCDESFIEFHSSKLVFVPKIELTVLDLDNGTQIFENKTEPDLPNEEIVKKERKDLTRNLLS